MSSTSKSKKIAVLLGASLLMLSACAPAGQTRGGAAQPAPVQFTPAQFGTDDDESAANPGNEFEASRTGAQPASAASAAAQQAVGSSALTSPLPTPTTEPTPRPTPESSDEIEFTGSVEVIASDLWVVGGRTVAVTAATEIKPGLAVGVLAKVHAVAQADGSLWAREIEPVVVNNGNDNANDNDNSNDDHDDGNSNSNTNSNDDNGNVNSNDEGGNSNDQGSDDHGNDNSHDDQHGNDNSHEDNSNDDHGNDNGNGG